MREAELRRAHRLAEREAIEHGRRRRLRSDRRRLRGRDPIKLRRAMSQSENPELLRTGHEVTLEDVRALMGASTPHFAMQLRVAHQAR